MKNRLLFYNYNTTTGIITIDNKGTSNQIWYFLSTYGSAIPTNYQIGLYGGFDNIGHIVISNQGTYTFTFTKVMSRVFNIKIQCPSVYNSILMFES